MYKESHLTADDAGDTASTPELWQQVFAAEPRRLRLRELIWRFVDIRYRLIRRHFKPGGRILDAGCGNGEWVGFLKQRGYRPIGLDYAPALLDRLRQRYPQDDWLAGTIQDIPLPDGAVDGVISWGVIEHDEAGPGAALTEFHRVLAPGGHALVTVPYDDAMARRASVAQYGAGVPTPGRPFFQYYFTTEELAAELTKAGFEVVSTGLCPPPSVAKMSPKIYAWLEPRPMLMRATLLVLQLFAPLLHRYCFMAYALGRKPT